MSEPIVLTLDSIHSADDLEVGKVYAFMLSSYEGISGALSILKSKQESECRFAIYYDNAGFYKWSNGRIVYETNDLYKDEAIQFVDDVWRQIFDRIYTYPEPHVEFQSIPPSSVDFEVIVE